MMKAHILTVSAVAACISLAAAARAADETAPRELVATATVPAADPYHPLSSDELSSFPPPPQPREKEVSVFSQLGDFIEESGDAIFDASAQPAQGKNKGKAETTEAMLNDDPLPIIAAGDPLPSGSVPLSSLISASSPSKTESAPAPEKKTEENAQLSERLLSILDVSK